jgi:hypothetical protein
VRALLLDEHVPAFYRVQLLRREPELTVWRIGQPTVPPKGTLDPEILCWCEEYDYLLVTNNRGSMPQHLADHLAAGRHVPGVLSLRPKAAIGRILEHLLLAAGASHEEELRDQIVNVPFW